MDICLVGVAQSVRLSVVALWYGTIPCEAGGVYSAFTSEGECTYLVSDVITPLFLGCHPDRCAALS
jgi:hypothetical protein